MKICIPILSVFMLTILFTNNVFSVATAEKSISGSSSSYTVVSAATPVATITKKTLPELSFAAAGDWACNSNTVNTVT